MRKLRIHNIGFIHFLKKSAGNKEVVPNLQFFGEFLGGAGGGDFCDFIFV